MIKWHVLWSYRNYPAYARIMHLAICQPFIVARLKFAGVKVGKGAKFCGFPIVSLRPNSSIIIGNGARLVSRSDSASLGVNHPVILRAELEGASIVIGTEVGMSGTTICASQSVVIGDYTRIGANVTIADTDFHSLDPSRRRDKDEANYARVAPIVIGHDVFIGASCFILKGVRVGDYAVVGAGSVVTKDVPDYAVVAGNPSAIVGDARKYMS